MSLKHLTDEINRIHDQQSESWRSKVIALHGVRDKLQRENTRLSAALIDAKKANVIVVADEGEE